MHSLLHHTMCLLLYAYLVEVLYGIYIVGYMVPRWFLPYSRLFLRGNFFMNWPIPILQGENFINRQDHLVINVFSKHFEGKFYKW